MPDEIEAPEIGIGPAPVADPGEGAGDGQGPRSEAGGVSGHRAGRGAPPARSAEGESTAPSRAIFV